MAREEYGGGMVADVCNFPRETAEEGLEDSSKKERLECILFVAVVAAAISLATDVPVAWFCSLCGER